MGALVKTAWAKGLSLREHVASLPGKASDIELALCDAVEVLQTFAAAPEPLVRKSADAEKYYWIYDRYGQDAGSAGTIDLKIAIQQIYKLENLIRDYGPANGSRGFRKGIRDGDGFHKTCVPLHGSGHPRVGSQRAIESHKAEFWDTTPLFSGTGSFFATVLHW